MQSTPDPVLPAPCSVTTTRLEIVSIEADTVTLRVDCSAGFYIRSLAHDLGERLGIGAHLAALRRTRTGDFTLSQSVKLDAAQREPERAVQAVIPLAAMLPGLRSVVLTDEGLNRVLHGRDIDPADSAHSEPSAEPLALSPQPFVKLLTTGGELVAIAGPGATRDLLHPSIVLV